MGKLTHLEAFCSDVAKRGRVWTDGTEEFMRDGEELWFRGTISRTAPWTRAGRQVAAMEGTVTWADEPKTLTPQEALRALADGECLQDDDVTVWVGFDGTFRGPNKDGVDGPVTIHRLGGFRIAPAHRTDPSQQAELHETLNKFLYNAVAPGLLQKLNDNIADGTPLPPVDGQHTKPPLKVGDRVKMGNSRGSVVWSGSERVHVEFDGVGVPTAHDLVDIEKIEAEPETPAPSFKAGDRVKRGPDYPSGLPAHDHAGVVCKLHDDGSCLVSWYDGGVTYPCRYGLDGKYDIEKIEAEPQVELSTCAKCGVK